MTFPTQSQNAPEAVCRPGLTRLNLGGEDPEQGRDTQDRGEKGLKREGKDRRARDKVPYWHFFSLISEVSK